MNHLQLSYSTIDRFIDTIWSEKGLSKLTLDAYQQDLKLFAQWLDKQDLTLIEASQTSILEYMAFKVDQKSAARSNARLLSTLKQF